MNEIVAAAKSGRGKGNAYSRMKAQWTDAVYWRTLEAAIPRLARVRLRFDWVSTDCRHNPDNIEAAQKFVWDGLVGPKDARRSVLENDGWRQNAGTEHRHEVGAMPGVWVTVTEDVL